MNKPPAKNKAIARASTLLAPDARIETRLHAACVKAGAGAALQVVLERLPLLKPFLPADLKKTGSVESADTIQRQLILAIYRSYQLKPAKWECEGILAVAQTQSVMSPLATRSGLDSLLSAWLPGTISTPLMRYTPLEPLVTATTKAIAATWAAGRYADSVCRLRKAGADWLPAPLTEALRLTPSTLRAWSAEALAIAMPPLRLANRIGRQLTGVRPEKKPAARKPARKRAVSAKKTPQ